MRVGGDDNGHAVVPRGGAGHVVQVKAFGMGVQFEHLPVVGRRPEHGFEVDLVGFSLVQEAPGRMGDGADARVLDRFDDAPGDSLSRLVLAVMDTCHDPISLGEDLVGQVEPAAFQNIDFNSLEDPEASEPAVDRVDFFPLAEKLIGIEPPGHGDAFGMIGHGQIREASLPGRGGHFLDGGHAVGPRAMGVQVAAEVLQPDQFRQRTGGGPFEFPPRLAEFRGKQRQVEDGIDVCLLFAGNPRLASKDAVLVDLQSPCLGHAAEDHVMGLGAGEVLKRRAERLGRDHAQVDLQTDAQPDGHFRAAAEQNLADRREPGEVVHHRLGIVGQRQQVEVPNRIPAAAIAARRLDPLDRRAVDEVRFEGLDDLVGNRPIGSLSRLFGDLEVLKNRRLRLRAKALDLADLAGLAGLAELIERVDAQLPVEDGRSFRPQPGNAEQSEHGFGNLGEQLVEDRRRAGRNQVRDLLGKVLANPFHLGQAARGVFEDRLDRLRQILDRPRSVAVGADAKGVRALKFKQIGHLLQPGGDFSVRHHFSLARLLVGCDRTIISQPRPRWDDARRSG